MLWSKKRLQMSHLDMTVTKNETENGCRMWVSGFRCLQDPVLPPTDLTYSTAHPLVTQLAVQILVV